VLVAIVCFVTEREDCNTRKKKKSYVIGRPPELYIVALLGHSVTAGVLYQAPQSCSYINRQFSNSIVVEERKRCLYYYTLFSNYLSLYNFNDDYKNYLLYYINFILMIITFICILLCIFSFL
jgi:hypothetical protein